MKKKGYMPSVPKNSRNDSEKNNQIEWTLSVFTIVIKRVIITVTGDNAAAPPW